MTGRRAGGNQHESSGVELGGDPRTPPAPEPEKQEPKAVAPMTRRTIKNTQYGVVRAGDDPRFHYFTRRSRPGGYRTQYR